MIHATQTIDTYDAEIRDLRTALARVTASRDKLAEALRKHGYHLNSCKAFPSTSVQQIARDCDCGLMAALAEHGGGK